MRDAFLRVYRYYSYLLWGAAVLAGMATFAIMWVIDINALSRKLFNAPLPAGVEITQALLPAVILLPFGYALLLRQHVNTVFLISRLTPRVANILHVFWMIVGCLLFAAITYGTFRYAMRSYDMNEQVWGAAIRFPVWPSKMAVSVGTALICIQFLLEAIRGVLIGDEEAGAGGEARLTHV